MYVYRLEIIAQYGVMLNILNPDHQKGKTKIELKKPLKNHFTVTVQMLQENSRLPKTNIAEYF